MKDSIPKTKQLRTKRDRSKSGKSMIPLLMAGALITAIIVGVTYFDVTTGLIGIFPSQSQFAPGATYAGNITPALTHADSIATTTTYNEGAHITTQFLRQTGVGAYVPIRLGNTSWDATAADGGRVFAEVTGSVGATLLLDIPRSLQDDHIASYAYIDYDGDANDDHLFVIDFSNLDPLTAGLTTRNLPIQFLWYNHQMPTGALNDPSDAFIVNIGGAQNNTSVYRFRFTWANFDRAALLRNIEIVFNSTATNKYEIDQVDIPFRGQLVSFKGSDMQEIIGTNATYRRTFASGRGDQGGWFIITKTGGVVYNDVVIHLTWTLAATDKVVMAINLNFWDDDEIQQDAQAEIVNHHTGPLA